MNTGVGELPPGAKLSDSDDNDLNDINDPHRALNIDLDLPLREDERLPMPEHRFADSQSTENKTDEKRMKKDKVIIYVFMYKIKFQNVFFLSLRYKQVPIFLL